MMNFNEIILSEKVEIKIQDLYLIVTFQKSNFFLSTGDWLQGFNAELHPQPLVIFWDRILLHCPGQDQTWKHVRVLGFHIQLESNNL